MGNIRIGVLALLLAAPALSAGAAAPGWTTGSDDGRIAIGNLARATDGDESVRVWGDVWSVCVSTNGGCAVMDVHGTLADDCDQYPVADVMWVYVTTPAVLEVTASGAAMGTWSAYTNGETGNFTKATIQGTSCVVFDDPDLTVVRSNGIVDYEF